MMTVIGDAYFEHSCDGVCNRETLRDCVRFAKATEECWNPTRWRQIPPALWEDTELCLELLSWLPSLYGCLPHRRKSDPDVVAALLASNPVEYYSWATLLGLIPVEVQLQHPALVLRVLMGYEDGNSAYDGSSDWHLPENALAPYLWRNREVVLGVVSVWDIDCALAAPAGVRFRAFRKRS